MLIYYQSMYFRSFLVCFQCPLQDRLHSCPWCITVKCWDMVFVSENQFTESSKPVWNTQICMFPLPNVKCCQTLNAILLIPLAHIPFLLNVHHRALGLCSLFFSFFSLASLWIESIDICLLFLWSFLWSNLLNIPNWIFISNFPFPHVRGVL